MEENKPKTNNVQTYAEDMAQVISANENGMIKQIIHQEEAYEKQKKNLSPDSKKNRFFVLASVVLLALALGALVFLITYKEKIQTADIKAQFQPIIFTDKTAYIEISELNKEKIIQSFLNELSTAEVKEGGVEAVYLTENKNVIGLSRFVALTALSLNNPNIFSESFLLGASNEMSKEPFILLQTRSFTDAFTSMRAWEEKMFYDLHDFFGVQVTADTNYLLTKDFSDGIIGNKNARVLYDNAGSTILAYIYVNDTFILISGSEVAALEIMSRLSSSKVGK